MQVLPFSKSGTITQVFERQIIQIPFTLLSALGLLYWGQSLSSDPSLFGISTQGWFFFRDCNRDCSPELRLVLLAIGAALFLDHSGLGVSGT